MMVLSIPVIVTGVAALYSTWRGALPHYGRYLGWLAVLLGATLASTQTGADKAVALSLIYLCLSGLAFVGISLLVSRRGRVVNRSRTNRAVADQGTQKKSIARPRGERNAERANRDPGYGKRLMWFITAGPLSACLAFSFAVLSHQWLVHLGMAPANALVLELFIFPILWGALVAWSLMGDTIGRKAVTIVSLLLVLSVLWSFAPAPLLTLAAL